MLNTYSSEDRILVAVDCIIFGFNGGELEVLLIKRDFEPERGKWSLIGGFLKKDEVLKDAAARILTRLTGMDNVYMEQCFAYSEVDRDPGERTISVAYFALINMENHNKKLISKYNARWFKLSEVPNLIFDHNEMLAKAIRRLRRRTAIKPIGFELLPEKFTMKQLQNLYESILDKPLDKRNFVNKINALGLVKRLKEKDMTTSSKGSYLYVFDKERYENDTTISSYLLKL